MMGESYGSLVEVYEELEATAKKLKKAEIIAKYIKKVPSKLLPDVILLLTGKIFPSWSEAEIGVARQLMIKAIAKATGESEKDIMEKFTSSGDLGKTVEHYTKGKKQRTLSSRTLSIKDVFDDLQKLAKLGGKGSQAQKINLIAGLLSNATPKEALYIVRTVLGELRIGVAEGIIRDAIAEAFELEKADVERAYHLHPDYGEVAAIAKEKGKAGLGKAKIAPGTPLIVLLAEKSPNLKTALDAFEHPLLEFKYDGMRTLIHKKDDKYWLFTRRLENVSKAFPDIVELCKKAIKAKECIIDSESLGIDPKTKRPLPFQALSTRIKRKYDIEKAAKEIPVQVNLFDILYVDGENLMGLPLNERREILKKQFAPIKGKFQLAKHLITKDFKKADTFYKKALKRGHEGVIVKNLDAHYVSGRRVAGGWLKVKPVMETLDLAIIGATSGAGKRAGWMGSFILGCREGGKYLKCGMLGTGVKEKVTNEGDVTFKDLTEMLKPYITEEKGNMVKIKPKILIEVAYEEIQKSPTYDSGFALRFPRFIRLRPDKKDADTVARIKKLYEQQKGKK